MITAKQQTSKDWARHVQLEAEQHRICRNGAEAAACYSLAIHCSTHTDQSSVVAFVRAAASLPRCLLAAAANALTTPGSHIIATAIRYASKQITGLFVGAGVQQGPSDADQAKVRPCVHPDPDLHTDGDNGQGQGHELWQGQGHGLWQAAVWNQQEGRFDWSVVGRQGCCCISAYVVWQGHGRS